LLTGSAYMLDKIPAS